ncbi:MAG: sel1 repeat family protein [Variovorax sp.]
MRQLALPVLTLVALLHGGQAWAQAAASTGAVTQSGAARAAVTVGTGNTPAPATPAGTIGSPVAGAGARYVESCQQALDRGVVNPGCQGPLYQSEIARLKEDALRTNNPNLLTLLGDAYQSNRSGVSDIGQAYRWYLLGAVRGDPRAMQRLSELYKNGRGAPQDNIKALGYARLTQRLAPPGSTSARQATEAITSLGGEMATEEMALAERFASDLENTIRRQGSLSPEAASATAGAQTAPSVAKTASSLARLPGMGAVQPEGAAPQPSAPPGSLPGRDSLTRQP